MNTNKITIIGSIIIILLIILIPTGYKVINNYHNNLTKVVEEKIISAAKKCYYEEKCLDNKVTLEQLYNLGYLDKINNPISKEYYNESSYVLIDSNKTYFNVIE